MTPPRVPRELTRGPFTTYDAELAGVSRRQLQGNEWCRLGPAIYCWKGWQQQPLPILHAVSKRLPEGAVFSGRTAGWVHGLAVSPFDPIEITVADPFASPSRGWLAIRRPALPDSEIVVAKGLRVTSAVRTVVDLARYQPLVEAVIAVDGATHAGVAALADLQTYASGHHGCHRARRLRQVLQLAEPLTESAGESKLRLILLLAGLPRPQAQVRLLDQNGIVIGRADLYYPNHRLVLEYDGRTHRETLVEDNRRQNRLLAAGFQLLRFTSADLSHSETIVTQVRTALARKARAA